MVAKTLGRMVKTRSFSSVGYLRPVSHHSQSGSHCTYQAAISTRVTRFFKTRLGEWADSKDPVERLSFYEYVKMDTFYPVSNFTNFPLPDKSAGSAVPSTGLLQGGFDTSRRDYDRIFLDLVRLLRGR